MARSARMRLYKSIMNDISSHQKPRHIDKLDKFRSTFRRGPPGTNLPGKSCYLCFWPPEFDNGTRLSLCRYVGTLSAEPKTPILMTSVTFKGRFSQLEVEGMRAHWAKDQTGQIKNGSFAVEMASNEHKTVDGHCIPLISPV